jgi:hypothetical protein
MDDNAHSPDATLERKHSTRPLQMQAHRILHAPRAAAGHPGVRIRREYLLAPGSWAPWGAQGVPVLLAWCLHSPPIVEREILRFLPGRHQTVGVSRRTWRRWMAGETRIPIAVVHLARILSGSLDELHPTWSNWMINRRTGALVDPEGVSHTPASVSAWHWTACELSALRAEENQRTKIQRIRTGRDGQVLTLELHRRLTPETRARRATGNPMKNNFVSE